MTFYILSTDELWKLKEQIQFYKKNTTLETT